MTVNNVVPGTLPAVKAVTVVVAPVTTGVAVVPGAVIVTTLARLTALYPTMVQAPVLTRVQALIFAAISVATSVVLAPVALAERICCALTVIPVTVPTTVTVTVEVGGLGIRGNV